MENNVSHLSYDTFESDLHNERNQTVVNSTTIEANVQLEIDSGKGNNPKVVTGNQRIIHLPLPYKCKECAKEFRSIENIRIHFMKHLSNSAPAESENAPSSPSPYKCRRTGCNRRFTSRNGRKNHEIGHVTAGKFSCERIEKVFKYK